MDNVVYCRSCGTKINESDAFCRNCGALQIVAQQENTQPAYVVAQQNIVSEPKTAPTATVKSKIFGGIGFGLSTFGFVFSLICFLMAMAAIDSLYSLYSDGLEYAIWCLLYPILYAATSIIGLIFSSIARKDGNTSGLTATGKVFGIIGIIIFALTFIIGVGVFSMY